MKKNNLLITGGAGFIGSHLAEALYQKNNLYIFDDLSSGKIENLKNIKKIKSVNFYNKKIENFNLDKKFDGIFHLCAQTSVPVSMKFPEVSSKSNFFSSIKVFEIARKQKIPIVYASSSAIYGNLNKGNDDINEFDIISPYALDKFVLENFANLYSKIYNISSIGLRFFNVYGPRQDPNSPYSGVITNFLNKIDINKKLIIYGGQQTRDFIYVSDIVKALIKSMKILINNKKSFNENINVGTGKQISINDLYKKLCNIYEKDLPYLNKGYLRGDPLRSLGSFKKMEKILKLNKNNFIKFNDGLKKTIKN